MSVNIKNIEAERLLKELAEEAGEGLTEAATHAFRERLERLRAENQATKKRELTSLLDLIAEARKARPSDSRSTKAITDELWGER